MRVSYRSYMQQLTSKNFGLLIANLLPGFTALWGASQFSETVRMWLGTTPSDAPSVGGFLYVTLASIGAGMTVSAVRFLVIDRIHHRTGISEPRWDFSRLSDNVAAYDVLIEIQIMSDYVGGTFYGLCKLFQCFLQRNSFFFCFFFLGLLLLGGGRGVVGSASPRGCRVLRSNR